MYNCKYSITKNCCNDRHISSISWIFLQLLQVHKNKKYTQNYPKDKDSGWHYYNSEDFRGESTLHPTPRSDYNGIPECLDDDGDIDYNQNDCDEYYY